MVNTISVKMYHDIYGWVRCYIKVKVYYIYGRLLLLALISVTFTTGITFSGDTTLIDAHRFSRRRVSATSRFPLV